jgi:glycosyltransferase involved in cell wall biosynthesis
MRVAVFTDNDFDKVNGVTTALSALVTYAPSDVEPRIYTAASTAADSDTYFAVKSIAVPIPFYTAMSVYLPHASTYLKRVVADEVDVVHLTTPGPMGLIALWVAKKAALPLVGSFHTDLQAYTTILSGSQRLGCWMGQYMRWMYGRCQRVLVPSDATRALLLRSGAHHERLELWTRGIDTEHFSPARRSNRLRAAWGVSDSRPALLYVGRVSREKGLEMLPDLVRHLHVLGVAHRLIVAGDGPLRGWLEHRCPEAVFTGTLGRKAVAEAFASADVFVFPSRTDTAGNVVLEAQAAGLPVVVSNVGGPHENMRPGATGVLCEGSEAARWATAVVSLLRDPALRRQMSAAARGYAMTRGWDSALANVYDTYRSVARPSAPPELAAHHAV